MQPIKLVEKLWGTEEWLVNDKEANYCLKKLTLVPGYRCSEHYHPKKDETFYVLSGWVKLVVNDVPHILAEGEFFRIKPFDIHYFQATDTCKAVFLEASTFHDDNDVVRMTDSRKL